MKRVLRVIILLFLISSVFIRQTYAFFIDSSTSSSNTFSAGSLDFELVNIDDTEITGNIVDATDMIPGDSNSGQFKIVNLGSLGFKYQIHPVFTGGSAVLYDNLYIIVNVDSTVVYSGDLSSMSLTPLSTLSGNFDNIEVEVGLSTGAPTSTQLTSCNFDLTIRGTQLVSSGGFWDEETVSGSVLTGDWTPPVVRNIMIASPGTDNGLIISWKTDEESKSSVELGTTTSYELGTFPASDPYNHSVNLTSVISLGTNYHFRIIANDAYGNTSMTDDYEFEVGWNWIDFIPRSNIVINEILPDPLGDDSASRPDGEWVELYNKGGFDVDVAGWQLCGLSGCVSINNAITMSGSTNVSAYGFLVVYFDGIGGLLRNNFDVVALYTGVWQIRDLHGYLGTQEGKSIVRYPDGANIWYDPIPSPGLPNNIDPVLPEEPKKEDEFVLPAPVEKEEPIVEEVILEEVVSE